MPQSGAVDALILTKTNARSTVHRPGYMDYIGVLSFDAKGKPIARAALPRPVHLQRLQPPPVGHPAGAPAPRLRDAASPAWRRTATAARRCATSWKRCRATSCSSPPARNCCAPRMGILGLQERVRSKPVPAPRPLRPLLLRRWSTSRATASTPTCACASRRCSSASCTASTSTPPCVLGESPLAQLHLIVRPKSGESVEVDNAATRGRAGRRSCATGRTSCASSWSRATARSAACALATRYRQGAAGRLHRRRHAPRSPPTTSSSLAALTGPDDLRLSLYRAHRGDGRPALQALPPAATTSRCRTRCR